MSSQGETLLVAPFALPITPPLVAPPLKKDSLSHLPALDRLRSEGVAQTTSPWAADQWWQPRAVIEAARDLAQGSQGLSKPRKPAAQGSRGG